MVKQPQSSEHFTVTEYAKEKDVTEETVRRWIRGGILGVDKVGRSYRIPKQPKIQASSFKINDTVAITAGVVSATLVNDILALDFGVGTATIPTKLVPHVIAVLEQAREDGDGKDD